MAEREASFTELCIIEAAGLPRKSQCCRRAFTFGLMLGGASSSDSEDVTLRVRTEELSELAVRLIKEQFGRDAIVRALNKAKQSYELNFLSSRAGGMITSPDTVYDGIMKCPSCRASFLCGLLCSCVSINDPRTNYYLSMRIDLDYKECVERALSECGLEASFRIMGRKGVFYMRASSRIEDFLALCGMQRLLFDFINQKIENEYRNNTNRAINIEVNNIKKTLASAKKHITAIEWMRENGRLGGLDPELYEAAMLRLENPECSLSALGAMMSPSVSKSGVLRRLNRIYQIYEDSKK